MLKHPRSYDRKWSPRPRNKTLAREVAHAWDQPIPRAARSPIWASVLASVSLCLDSDINRSLSDEIQQISDQRDLKRLIYLKKQKSSPQLYGDARSYFASATVLNLFAKTEQPVKGIDPLATAVERFQLAEKLCGATNKRMLHYRKFDHHGRPLPKRLRMHEIFHLARRKIQNWLGPLDVVNVLAGARHGPGGVVGLKRPVTTPYFKFAKQGYTCSRGAYWYAVRAIASNDAWIRSLALEEGLIGWDHSVSCIPFETRLRLADACITITEENEVTFVNKDALTKRSISVEPHLNVFLQLGVGRYLKGCLRKAGCDLSDQTRNQELAKVGSEQHEGEDPVTLDLSMASDTLAIEVVRELLPPEWFDFLCNLRSARGSYRGSTFDWKKFSSMGNGFTFELESMIFYALAQACSDLTDTTQWFSDTFGPAYRYAYVSVFGDDIIVPKKVASSLISALRYCGFQLNLDKSFVDGPFRESCGKDYWNGILVRPFYMKRGLTCVRDLIHLHNGLKDMDRKFDGRLAPTLKLIRSMLPVVVERHLRGVNPTLGDGYIWCEPDEAMTSGLVAWHDDWQRWQLPECRSKPVIRAGGRAPWRLLQLLYVRTDREFREVSWQDDPFVEHLSRGGSAADVVESGRGTTTLAWC